MVEFLFGWAIKPQYEVTFLDGIIAAAVIMGLYFLSVCLYAAVQTIKEKVNERKN